MECNELVRSLEILLQYMDKPEFKKELILEKIRAVRKRIANKQIQISLRKLEFEMSDDSSIANTKTKQFIVMMLAFCKPAVKPKTYKEDRHISKENIYIILTSQNSAKSQSRRISRDCPFTRFHFAGNILIVRPRPSKCIIQELINEEQRSIISINKSTYILSKDQYYEIKDFIFKIKDFSDNMLRISAYRKKIGMLEYDKDLDIVKSNQYVICKAEGLFITARSNVAAVMKFFNQNNNWVLFAEERLVWRLLGNPEVCENIMTDPILVSNNSWIKCLEDIYSFKLEETR